MCYRLSNLFITDTKGTNLSVCIREIRNCLKFDSFGTMQAPVIQKVDSAYPVDNSLSSGLCNWFSNTSPLDSDLSGG